MTETLDNDETELMSEAAILGALQAIRMRISKAEAQCAELEHNITLAKAEKQLLEKLLALRRGESEGPKPVQPPVRQSSPTDNATNEVNHPVVEAVLGELNQAGRPLHISDLMRLLHERHVSIPGLGTQANLISYLRRDRRLVRPSWKISQTWQRENAVAERCALPAKKEESNNEYRT